MKVAINGFGRIGRICLRTLLEKAGIQVLAVNDLADTSTLAHLFRYDSVHGGYPGKVSAGDHTISVNGAVIRIFSEREPQKLPWKELGIDLVIESTGKFLTKDKASLHLAAGAKQVIISAPS